MAASTICVAKRQRRLRSSPIKLATPTAARLQDHRQAFQQRQGARAPGGPQYSGSSKNTIALIVSETVKATAEPMMIPIKTAIGRMECLQLDPVRRFNRSATAI